MATSTTRTNKPIIPRGQDASPLKYNRAALYSGKALDFDGVNDYIDLAGFTLSGSVASFSFYVNADGTGNVYFLDANPNRFVLRFSNNNVALFSGSLVEFGAINTNEWTHLVYVLNGTSAKCYANGVQLGTEQTITAIDLSAATDFDLGRWYLGGAFYDGGMANFKTFSTALTAAQVSDLYNNPEKIVPTGVADSALKLWLPMMEGAGTTAYDGSGNGNHGTISGATWTHGIGSPVAQTAVIDWNKGTNLFPYSEDLSDSQWDKSATRITYAVDQTTAPDGRTTADEIIEAATTGDHLVFGSYTTSTYTDYTASIYMKDNTRGFGFVQIAPNAADTTKRYTIVVDLSDGSVTDTAGNSTGSSYDVTDAGNGWYRISVTRPHTAASTIFIVYGLADSGTPTYDSQFEPTYTGDGTSSLYVWGASLTASSSVAPYIPTLSTAQTSDVLLPQGLTSGRDITGVNLFENVRKQGALNLDGNSWAEVHDNASLDITDAVSLEMWIYWEDQSAEKTILGKWVSGDNRAYALIATTTTGEIDFRQRISSSTYQLGISTLSSGWNHVVATHDHSANERIGYINGVQVSLSSSQGVNNESDNNITIGGHSVAQYTQPIAQPRIYNRALTAEEVARNFSAHKSIYTNS